MAERELGSEVRSRRDPVVAGHVAVVDRPDGISLPLDLGTNEPGNSGVPPIGADHQPGRHPPGLPVGPAQFHAGGAASVVHDDGPDAGRLHDIDGRARLRPPDEQVIERQPAHGHAEPEPTGMRGPGIGLRHPVRVVVVPEQPWGTGHFDGVQHAQLIQDGDQPGAPEQVR